MVVKLPPSPPKALLLFCGMAQNRQQISHLHVFPVFFSEGLELLVVIAMSIWPQHAPGVRKVLQHQGSQRIVIKAFCVQLLLNNVLCFSLKLSLGCRNASSVLHSVFI